MNQNQIRASMLPSYIDCSRRAIAKGYRREVVDAGYLLRETAGGAAAALGTSAHAAVEHQLRHKMDTGALGSMSEALEHAVEVLGKGIEEGVTWDDTTPSRDAAIKQVTKQLKVYQPIVETIEPIGLEVARRASIGSGWELTGHIDIIEAGRIRDEKFGAADRPYWVQLGAYSLLEASAGHEIRELILDWIPRVKKDQHQPPVQSKPHDVAECENGAKGMILRVKADIEAWRERPDDPDRSLIANPMSTLCSDKFCPAHGTSFCNAWKYR